MTHRRHKPDARPSRLRKVCRELRAHGVRVEELAHAAVVPAGEEDERVGREAECGRGPGERGLPFGAGGHGFVGLDDVGFGALDGC